MKLFFHVSYVQCKVLFLFFSNCISPSQNFEIYGDLKRYNQNDKEG